MALTCLLLSAAAHLDEAHAQSVDLGADISTETNGELTQSGETARLDVARAQAPRGPGLAAPAYTPQPLSAGKGYIYFTGDLPVTWNSNPALVARDARESARFDPKLQLNAAYQTSLFQLSLVSTADLDRYSSNSEADANNVQSLVKLAFKRSKDSGFSTPCERDAAWGRNIVPYAMYQSSLKFSADYDTLKASLNDVGAGLSLDSTVFGLPPPPKDKNGEVLKESTCGGYPYPQLGFDVQFTQRYANIGANSRSLYAKPSVTFNFSNTFAATFQPSFRVRWYDGIAGVSRRDETVIIPAAVAWDPSWLPNGSDSPIRSEFRLTMQFTRNWSNVAGKEARQWDVGPLLEFVAVPASGGD